MQVTNFVKVKMYIQQLMVNESICVTNTIDNIYM